MRVPGTSRYPIVLTSFHDNVRPQYAPLVITNTPPSPRLPLLPLRSLSLLPTAKHSPVSQRRVKFP
jgi:hypothetical protein